jgi:hypothetical protein
MGRGEASWDEVGDDIGDQFAGVPSHPVVRALELVDRALDVLDGSRTWSLSDAELRDGVAGLHRRMRGLEAAWLGLVRDLDGRPEAVPGARAGEVAKTFLHHRLRLGRPQAGRDARAAQTLDPDGDQLPNLSAAFAAGEVCREHVDVAVAARSRIPSRWLTRRGDGPSGAELVDLTLTEHARTFCPQTAQGLARHLLAVLDPAGTDRYDPEAFTRRSLSCATDSTGMLVGRFQLDPAGAAAFKAALTAYSRPSPATVAVTSDEREVQIADDRTAGQRNADALAAISRIAVQQLGEPGIDRVGPAAHISVIATADQVAAARQAPGARPAPTAPPNAPPGAPAGLAECLQTGPVTPGTLGRLACDAVLQAVLTAPSGAVLALGRSVRTVSAGQRKALIVRDGAASSPAARPRWRPATRTTA